ncbi:MAG: GNAT family N-acetyltransferase, partial [Phenylobacterium sp.]
PEPTARSGPGSMPKLRVIDRLATLERRAWDRLFPGELEGYDYLAAVESAGIEGFRWRYLLVEEQGRLLAAAPAFLTEYPLETTLAGPARRVADGLRRVAPEALTLRLACIGSPCTETALLGFDPAVTERQKPQLLRQILAGLDQTASRERCGLLGIKDVAEGGSGLWSQAAPEYRALASLPSASLDIDFTSIDAYLQRLSPATRKDMRRKLKALDQVRVETRASIDDVLDPVMALYAETRARAEMALEDLTPAYFQGVLRRLGDRAFCTLYWQGADLLAVNLLLQDGDTLLDKFFCMNAERGRPLNLYFLSWFTNVRLCLERGLSHYRSGQAGYENKLRLGSTITRNANYFRHRNALLNGGLRLVAPLFAADPVAERAA